ncbi:hypothetical protein [Sphingosinicella terrae]|uniref:hypothetical protein n=1 Tax=Sphingosinicella terrae TaxID=2172047 RepID=UPI000E0D1528|nr:hypothetical protein [Sphingosinicella terrae]
MDVVYAIGIERCDGRVEELRAEFGSVLADRIVEAEAAEFLWEARVLERYLGQHVASVLDDEEASQELSRVGFVSALDGRWYAGICLVDGEGAAVDLLWKRSFESYGEARLELHRAR